MNLRLLLKSLLATLQLQRADRDAVLLTFDDGPHPEGTPAVLDVLRRHSARAVFFIVGSRIARAPDMLRRVVEEGHFLGNHSYAHPLGKQLGLAACRRDLEQCQQVVMDLTGLRPTMFRPPLGHLSPASIIAPRMSGLLPVLWSVDSDDWRLRAAEDVPPAAERLLTKLSHRPLRDIVLLHDERPSTAQLLDLVLPVLASRHVDLSPGLNRIGMAAGHQG